MSEGGDSNGTPSPRAQEPRESPDFSGPMPEVEGYDVTGILGQGGMGTVWRAVQLSTSRDVALKLLGKGAFASEKDRARFEREVELTARLNHPNIAQLFDSGVHQSVYYYAMELIDGAPLDKYVERQGLNQRQILELMRTVCSAVQHAHERGVIHRDLKPSNILVTPDGRPHVLDFGLAKGLLEEDFSLTVSAEGQPAGTPTYMSPEQAAGRLDEIDTRTDVYALGVILFRLLTGESPHDLSGTRYEVLRRIAEEEVRRPRDITKEVDRELEALLLKALARHPKHRYASAGALGQDVENYLTGEPLAARTPTTAYFLRKRLWKYRGRVAIASALVAMLIGVTLIAYFRVVRAEKLALERLDQSQRARNALEDKAESAREVYNIVLEALDRMNAPSVSPLDTLEEADRDAQTRFADRPEVQAAAHVEIGKVYSFLEEFARAEEQFQKAVPILERELGEDHRDTITARGFLSIALSRLYKIDEWGSAVEQQLASRLREFGLRHPDTVRSMENAATARWRSDDLEGAQKLGKLILQIREEMGTTTDLDGLKVPERLALLLEQIGKLDEAQDLLKRAVEIREDIYGKEDTGTLSAKSALAFLLLKTGDIDGAMAINKEIFETRSRTQGETHADTQWAKSNMDVLSKEHTQPHTVTWKGDVLAHDGFEGELTLAWEILNSDPSHFSLTKNPGALTITTQEGEFARSNTAYENLFLIPCPTAPGDDFQVTACVRGFQPLASYNQAGLICYNDDDNYVKLVYQWSTSYHSGRVFTVGIESGGQFNHVTTLAPLELDTVWLRIAKKGNQYWFATSRDGRRYDPLGCLARDTTGLFQGHALWGDGTVARVGLFAVNSSEFEAPEIDACFDFFEVRSFSEEADQSQAGTPAFEKESDVEGR